MTTALSSCARTSRICTFVESGVRLDANLSSDLLLAKHGSRRWSDVVVSSGLARLAREAGAEDRIDDHSGRVQCRR